MKRNLMILGLVIVAIAAILVWNTQSKERQAEAKKSEDPSAAAEAPLMGKSAPSFSLKSIDGSTSYSVGGKRDKALIVNFWASWCGPCDREAGDLVKLYDKYKDRVDLYAVNATKYDTVRGAKDFVKEKGLPFPVIMDTNGTVEDEYKVYSFPISFIIDKDGVVRERIEGVQSLENWEQMLDKALAANN